LDDVFIFSFDWDLFYTFCNRLSIMIYYGYFIDEKKVIDAGVRVNAVIS